jgi:predicted heme/steroid binding protein
LALSDYSYASYWAQCGAKVLNFQGGFEFCSTVSHTKQHEADLSNQCSTPKPHNYQLLQHQPMVCSHHKEKLDVMQPS